MKRSIFLYFVFLLSMSLGVEARSYSPVKLTTLARNKEPGASVKTKGQLGPLIVLDAGHGGRDEGAKVGTLQEKKLALLTTLYMKKFLEEFGYRVVLTRGRDIYVSLSKRVFIANTMNGELFVSIHFNSARNPLAQGLEVFYGAGKGVERERASRKLANFLLHYVMDQTGALSRGVKVGNHLHVVRETQMPAVLFEAGFMTHPDEWKKMKQKTYLEKIAKGLAQGVDRYLKS